MAELPLIERTIRENKHSLAFCLSMVEVTQVYTAVFFIHSSEAIRSAISKVSQVKIATVDDRLGIFLLFDFNIEKF